MLYDYGTSVHKKKDAIISKIFTSTFKYKV